MAKFRVIELTTTMREYEVETKDREKAINKVRRKRSKPVKEEVIDTDYHTENLTFKEELKKGGEKG